MIFTGYEQARLNHLSPVYLAKFSNKGDLILTASSDNLVKLWDLNGKLLLTIKNFTTVKKAVFSHDDKLIMLNSICNHTKVYTIKGKLIFKHMHEVYVRRAYSKYDPSFNLGAVCTTKIWELNGKLVNTFYGNFFIDAPRFSDDGKYIITTSGKSLRSNLFNIRKLILDGSNISEAVFYSNSEIKYLVMAKHNKVVVTRKDGVKLAILHHKGKVNSAIFSQDGNLVLTSSDDCTAKLWNAKGELIQSFYHNEPVLSAIFSRDSFHVLTASDDGTARLWQ